MDLVNKERMEHHLKIMSSFTATPNAGMTRYSYSPEDVKTRNYMKEKMKEYGLTVREDGIGNIYGKLDGTLRDERSVIVGSHFDSVPNGGNYDGPAGIIAGLEVAAMFQEQQLKPAYPLEVIAMVEEEGSRFVGGMMGSRAVNGMIDKEDLHSIQDKDGISVASAMKEAGLDPSLPMHRKPETMKAFLELHIEQGPVLEKENISIGVVDAIVGIMQLEVTVEGRAGHAGTTPMDQRADALVTAAKIIAELPDLVKDEKQGTVITTGELAVFPNGANVIPEKVVFSVDLRSGEGEPIKNVQGKLDALVSSYHKGGIRTSLVEQLYIEPKSMSPGIRSALKEASETLGISYIFMQSGAGHDAMIFSDFTEAGMIFIPSKDGISHHPAEWSDMEHLAQGADVLFETVKKLTEAI